MGKIGKDSLLKVGGNMRIIQIGKESMVFQRNELNSFPNGID